MVAGALWGIIIYPKQNKTYFYKDWNFVGDTDRIFLIQSTKIQASFLKKIIKPGCILCCLVRKNFISEDLSRDLNDG